MRLLHLGGALTTRAGCGSTTSAHSVPSISEVFAGGERQGEHLDKTIDELRDEFVEVTEESEEIPSALTSPKELGFDTSCQPP